MSSLAPSLKSEVVCLWDHGVFRTERVNGFYDAVRHVWGAEGARGLWKGVGTTLSVFNSSIVQSFTDYSFLRLIAVPSQTCYMLTYDHLSNVTLPPLIPSPYLVPLASGILARTAITTIASPLELIRTNLQATPLSAHEPQTLRSVLSSIRTLVRENGARSLWRGLGPTLWRDVPFSGIYWATYERCKQALHRPERPVAWVAFVSGAFSGTFSALLTSPFDVLKTRRQALLMSSQPRVIATIPLLLHIVRAEGYAALFAGLKPRIAKIAPACGIMITCFEVSHHHLLTTDDVHCATPGCRRLPCEEKLSL